MVGMRSWVLSSKGYLKRRFAWEGEKCFLKQVPFLPPPPFKQNHDYTKSISLALGILTEPFIPRLQDATIKTSHKIQPCLKNSQARSLKNKTKWEW